MRLFIAFFLSFLIVDTGVLYAKRDKEKTGKHSRKESNTEQPEAKAKTFLDKNKNTKEVEVKWGYMELARYYRFQIYNHRNKMLLDTKVEENAIKLNLKPGKYSLRVAGISQYGVQGQWSDRTPFTVEEDNIMAQKEINESVRILKETTKKIEEESNEASVSALGFGASDIIGVGFEYATLNTDLASFDTFKGGMLLFRYHRIFYNNVKPEVRLGYIHGTSNSAAVESMGILKLYGSLGYSQPMFTSQFFLVTMLGGGLNYLIVNSEYAGKTFLSSGFAASVELSYQPVRRFRIFMRTEYTYILTDAISFIAPGVGVMWKF